MCPYFEVFFGGARGGGKTYALLLKWVHHWHQYGRLAHGIILRRSYDELTEVIEIARKLLVPMGCEYKQQAKTIVMPDGAVLRLRFLKSEADYDKYHGHAYTFMGVDEITNWPTPDGINKMKSTIRSAHGVRCQFVATGNPGGPGHNWVKRRYIDPAPPFKAYKDPVTGITRVFIPSLLEDNPALFENDPDYVNRLMESGPEWLVKAWIAGDWDIVAGGMFDDLWDPRIHIVEPFPVPDTWYRDRSFDWGSSAPFSVGFWAESNGEEVTMADGTKRSFPRGTLFRTHEWYGMRDNQPNVGTKMLAVDVAAGILDIQRRIGFHNAGPADTSIYTAENGVCIADDMAGRGVVWTHADKSPGSRINGWERIRKMLAASVQAPMEDPGLFIFNTCRDFIRTFPVLPRDSRNPDDLDTATEDHIADETRYRVMKVMHTIRTDRIGGT